MTVELSTPISKFKYLVKEDDTLEFKYTDDNDKCIIFQLKNFTADPDDPESLIVDYEHSFLDEGLDKDQFNRDFSLFVSAIIEETFRQESEALIDTSTKLSDIV